MKNWYYQKARFRAMVNRMTCGGVLVLSYPKCGRTWIMNLLANYLERTARPSAAPLPFMLEQNNKYFDVVSAAGVSFTHGGPVNDIFAGRDTLASLRLDRRRCAFLLRDPLLVSISLYHHLAAKDELSQADPLKDFLASPRGVANVVLYDALAADHAGSNQGFKPFYYEDFHVSAPDHLDNVATFIQWVTGGVDRSALAWAYEQCLPGNLKARAVVASQRVRKAEATVEYSRFESIRRTLDARICALPSPAARTMLQRYVQGGACD